MIVFCPNSVDEHAPFPHRLVIVTTSHVVRSPKTRKVVVIEDPNPTVLVICAFCDHWIKHPKGVCDCPVNCHQTVIKPARRSTKIG